jgi:hypothetical protein
MAERSSGTSSSTTSSSRGQFKQSTPSHTSLYIRYYASQGVLPKRQGMAVGIVAYVVDRLCSLMLAEVMYTKMYKCAHPTCRRNREPMKIDV